MEATPEENSRGQTQPTAEPSQSVNRRNDGYEGRPPLSIAKPRTVQKLWQRGRSPMSSDAESLDVDPIPASPDPTAESLARLKERVRQATAGLLPAAHPDGSQIEPLAGVIAAARIMTSIWAAVQVVDLNRNACLRLAERSANILISIREGIVTDGSLEPRDTGGSNVVLSDDLRVPMERLVVALNHVLDLLEKQNRGSFLKRYLKREETQKEIAQCDSMLTDALGMFDVAIQLRVLKQIVQTESQRQADSDVLLKQILRTEAQRRANKDAKQGNLSQQTPPAASQSHTPAFEEDPDAAPSAHVFYTGITSEEVTPDLVVSESSSQTDIIDQITRIAAKDNEQASAQDAVQLRQLLSEALAKSDDTEMMRALLSLTETPEAINALKRTMNPDYEAFVSQNDQNIIFVSDSLRSGTSFRREESKYDQRVHDTTTLDPESAQSGPGLENSYLKFIFERVSTQKPELCIEYRRVFEECRRLSSNTLFREFAKHCASAQESETGKQFVDAMLCAMQEVHENEEKPWYNSGTGLSGRILLKFSQTTGAIPSTLFVEDVSYTDRDAPIGGMGSFADVHRGTRSGNSVALKRLRILYDADTKSDKHFKMLFRESLMWKQLRHRSILPFIGLDKKSFPGTICMVSPWMSNGDLARYMRYHSGVNMQQRATWVGQIASGLAYLHEEPCVVHGDLRCANILLDIKLDAYISDFGLSLFEDAGMSTMGLTSWNEGAKRWMAPEVLNTGKCTTEGDTYSFGCVCLEIVCGEIPFCNMTDRQILKAVTLDGQQPYWPASTISFQEELGRLVRPCWDRDPDARPRMHQLWKDLTSLLRELGMDASRGANVHSVPS